MSASRRWQRSCVAAIIGALALGVGGTSNAQTSGSAADELDRVLLERPWVAEDYRGRPKADLPTDLEIANAAVDIAELLRADSAEIREELLLGRAYLPAASLIERLAGDAFAGAWLNVADGSVNAAVTGDSSARG